MISFPLRQQIKALTDEAITRFVKQLEAEMRAEVCARLCVCVCVCVCLFIENPKKRKKEREKKKRAKDGKKRKERERKRKGKERNCTHKNIKSKLI